MILPFKSDQSKQKKQGHHFHVIGSCIVFSVFFIFGTWAAFAPLDSAAVAQGVIKVDGNRKQVQHLEGGIVSDILVNEGDSVKKGQLLIILDDTQARSERQIVYGQLLTALADEVRLLAEMNNKQTLVFPEYLNQDKRGHEAALSAESKFKANFDSRNGEVEVLKQQIEQLKLQAIGLEALINSKDKLVTSYQQEVNDLNSLIKRGFSDKQRMRELERERDTIIGEIAEHKSSIASTKVKITEAELKIIQIDKIFKTEIANELAKAQAEIFNFRERFQAIEDRVIKSKIKSSVDGIVMSLNTHTIGGVIKPGDSLMEIVPKGAELVVEAQIMTRDIDTVSIGMKADLRFPSLNTKQTPVIPGILVDVSADRYVNEENGVSYYIGRLKVDKVKARQIEGFKMIPGMPVEAIIKTGSRTLLQYLAKPALNAIETSLIEK